MRPSKKYLIDKAANYFIKAYVLRFENSSVIVSEDRELFTNGLMEIKKAVRRYGKGCAKSCINLTMKGLDDKKLVIVKGTTV